jgi:tetratricopeptide (TPR) repeat protein
MPRRKRAFGSEKPSMSRSERTEITFRFSFLGIPVAFCPPRIIDLGKSLAGSLPAILGLSIAVSSVLQVRSADRSTALRSSYIEKSSQLTADDPKSRTELVFARLLSSSSSDFRIWNRYLDYLVQTGQQSRLMRILQGLTPDEAKGNAQFHFRLANLLLSDPAQTDRQIMDAERHLRFAADLDDGPSGILAARKIALLQIKRGDLAGAVKTLEPIMAESPVAGAESLWLAWSGNLPFDPNGTARVLDRVERDLRAQRIPDPDIVLAKLRLLVMTGRAAEAQEWLSLQRTLTPAIRSSIDSEFAEMQLVASMKGSADGDLPDWSKLEEVLKRKPDDPIWLTFVVNIWAGQQRVGSEPARLWVQSRLDNDSAGDFLLRQALVTLSAQYEAFGRTPEDSAALRTLYRKFLKRFPQDAVAMNNLAVLIYKHEPANLEEGLKLAAEADRISPNQPGIQETIGQLLARLGRFDQARPILEKCLGPLPNEWGLHNTLLQIYEKSGERQLSEAHRAILANLPRPLDAASYEKLQPRLDQDVSTSGR